jgi:hypothetical protein
MPEGEPSELRLGIVADGAHQRLERLAPSRLALGPLDLGQHPGPERLPLRLVQVEVVRRRVLPVSVLHNAQQPVVLPSLLKPVLAVGPDEPGQVAGCEGAGGFCTLFFAR